MRVPSISVLRLSTAVVCPLVFHIPVTAQQDAGAAPTLAVWFDVDGLLMDSTTRTAAGALQQSLEQVLDNMPTINWLPAMPEDRPRDPATGRLPAARFMVLGTVRKSRGPASFEWRLVDVVTGATHARDSVVFVPSQADGLARSVAAAASAALAGRRLNPARMWHQAPSETDTVAVYVAVLRDAAERIGSRPFRARPVWVTAKRIERNSTVTGMDPKSAVWSLFRAEVTTARLALPADSIGRCPDGRARWSPGGCQIKGDGAVLTIGIPQFLGPNIVDIDFGILDWWPAGGSASLAGRFRLVRDGDGRWRVTETLRMMVT